MSAGTLLALARLDALASGMLGAAYAVLLYSVDLPLLTRWFSVRYRRSANSLLKACYVWPVAGASFFIIPLAVFARHPEVGLDGNSELTVGGVGVILYLTFLYHHPGPDVRRVRDLLLQFRRKIA